MTSNAPLKRTALYQDHIVHHAKMVPFGGWDMPLQYSGILDEHAHTRAAVTVFDISHMGEFIIHGDPVNSGLDRIVTQTLTDLPVKACRYGAMLNDAGGVLDDLIVFRMQEDKWFLVVNAATTAKDADHIRTHLRSAEDFEDVSAQIGKVDIQGPHAREVMQQFVGDIGRLDYYTFDFFPLLGENVLISRTGYTGELGYEIFYPWDKTTYLWNALLEAKGVKPAGLGARDLLRLEVGYSLYGHELSEDVSALECGLSRFIDFEKEFIGKDALMKKQEHPLPGHIIGLVSNTRRSPRAGHKIYTAAGKAVGTVTSGAYSPQLKKGIGLARVEGVELHKDDLIRFGSEEQQEEAAVSSKIFYRNGSVKS
ncbi:MAG: glycine cleavage system aminomethyltransferase GcvT [Candidatus Omnitrophica bacterium]|nr:glycine cleavage system aminomethyltransferase GcvT [Candidatus Omnitrophota bacterium]MCB9720872.1 glycine cleavage system aminomethyltransferase GcvT [Candidatus Omnitrophota bacterium]